MPSKILRGSQLKEFRHRVARLKELGLVSKRVDARRQKSTRYMREQVEKRFRKIFTGEAVAVKVPRRKDAKTFSEGFDTKGRNVIIELEKGAKRPRFSKKTGEIKGDVELYGKKFKRIYTPVNADNLHRLPKGKRYKYTIPIGGGFRSFDTYTDLESFMYPYEKPAKGSSHHAYKDWQKHVLVEELGDVDLTIGMRVFHKRWKHGTVLAILKLVTVNFDDYGIKQVAAETLQTSSDEPSEFDEEI